MDIDATFPIGMERQGPVDKNIQEHIGGYTIAMIIIIILAGVFFMERLRK